MKRKWLSRLLKFSLLVTIPVLLILVNERADALKLLQLSKSEMQRVKKQDLLHSSLQDRIDWLAGIVPTRIPKIMDQIEKNKSKISLIVYKKERVMELWLRGKTNMKLKTYKMYGFSGKLGPKNRQGDRQIPEGVYRGSVLNANSRYYLSIGINYPNTNDKKRGERNQIKDLGGDIYIHGRNVTIGCVPIGDHFIEEVFYIVGTVGLMNTRIVIAPTRLPLPPLTDLDLDPQDPLLAEKYSNLTAELTQYL